MLEPNEVTLTVLSQLSSLVDRLKVITEKLDVKEKHRESVTELISTDAAARSLGISRTKIWDLIAKEELSTVRIGRARRIARSELERFITEATD